MSAVLEVHNLVKKYGGKSAVDDISFDIQEGEIFSLLGPNGAGKTTTISILSTLFTPTEGDAEIFGYSVTKNPMEVKRLIGVVPQEIALYDDMTALENLNFWGEMYGLSGSALKTRVKELLEQIGLADRAKERIKTYSGKLAENVTSGTARDVMFHRLPDVEEAGYKVVLRVHDELVCEVPDSDEFTHERLAEIMCRPFDWSTGLPLAADGFETKRYRK